MARHDTEFDLRGNPVAITRFHRHVKEARPVDRKGDSNHVNARKKLNSANIAGSLIIAMFVGAVAGSWWVFGGTAVVLLGLNLHDGGIRPKPTKRKR